MTWREITTPLALLAVLAAAPVPAARAAGVTIHGAGATFPYPLYAAWAWHYAKETGVRVNYQSIGSGGGIRQIQARAVDFGASDAPVDADDLDRHGLVQFPMVIGGVVPVVNLPGVRAGELRLTPDLLAALFLGRIPRWNDPALTAANPGISLPDLPVTVVHRADGSGTTWIFSHYLDKVSPDWHEAVGYGKALQWPAGIGAKGNEGVASYVQRVRGAVGYVEYAYALQNKMTHAALKNRAGRFARPTAEAFAAAAAGADWAGTPGFGVVLTDQPGEGAWPITGASFLLVPKEPEDCAEARAMLDFFDWAYRRGAGIAGELHYIPLPAEVVSLVEAAWAREIRCKGEPLWKAASPR